LSNEFDVAVVGADPVGLWIASELGLAKVNVAVLKRRAEPVTWSRALRIQGRTLEVFALRGLADRFVSRGRSIPKGHFGGLDKALDLSVFDMRFPFTMAAMSVSCTPWEIACSWSVRMPLESGLALAGRLIIHGALVKSAEAAGARAC
jgi:2-polyprenyl-6-methoxyphenol hydroxylase-like FAD-dependent oxidoreductase